MYSRTGITRAKHGAVQMQEAMTGAGLAEAGLTPHNNLSQTETPIEKMTQKRQ